MRCIKNDKHLQDWYKGFPGDDEDAYHASLLALARYGMTDSRDMCDAGALKMFFFSFCISDWVSIAEIGHCEVCNRCHTLGEDCRV